MKYPCIKWQWIFYFLRIDVNFPLSLPTWLCIWVTRRVSYKKQETAYPSTWVHPRFIVVSLLLIFFRFFLCCPVVCLCILWFRVVVSVAISAWERCSVRLCLQLFVGGLMSCLLWFAFGGVRHILCCIFVLFVFFLCAVCCPFSGLSIFDNPSVISNLYPLRLTSFVVSIVMYLICTIMI